MVKIKLNSFVQFWTWLGSSLAEAWHSLQSVLLSSLLTFSGFPGTALLLCCGCEPTQRQITAFSRPREHMWLVQHMDWVTLLFFSFSERSYMAWCLWNKNSNLELTPPCWHAAQFLCLPLISLSLYLSSLFLGNVVRPRLRYKHITPLPLTLHHVPYITFFPEGATVSSFPLFCEAWTSLFILDRLPFPETLHGNTCRGLNPVHCFHSSLPHLHTCGAGCVLV